jgi:hypothetical protein
MVKTMPNMRKRNHGFLTVETSIALVVLTLMLALLATTMGQQRRASLLLADDRAAVRLAERVLAGVALDPKTLADPQIVIEAEPLLLTSQAHAPGRTGDLWVRVTVTCRQRTQSLIGLMPVERLADLQREVYP